MMDVLKKLTQLVEKLVDQVCSLNKRLAVLERRSAMGEQPTEPCFCDRQGLGKPGVSCGDCPTRDYKPAAGVEAPSMVGVGTDQIEQPMPTHGASHLYGVRVVPVWPTVDEFAQHIRWINGSNKMGAASLAEKLLEWLQSRNAGVKPVRTPSTEYVLVRLKRPEGYEDVHPELVLEDAGINPVFEPEIVPREGDNQ